MNDKIEQAITFVKIQQRIAALESDMSRFIEQANRQVAAYEQRIAELKELIGENKPPVDDPV